MMLSQMCVLPVPWAHVHFYTITDVGYKTVLITSSVVPLFCRAPSMIPERISGFDLFRDKCFWNDLGIFISWKDFLP